MKKSETDRDFLDLVKNTLDNYEEQYILGSWENFVKTRKRRRKSDILEDWRRDSSKPSHRLAGIQAYPFISFHKLCCYRSRYPENTVIR